MGNFFGTDGIRGIFGQTLTPSLAKNVGNALCQVKSKPKILIGSDTRLSSDILKCSLAVGVMLGGGDVVDIGIVPTSCVSYLTETLAFDYGVMISASHNPPEYNGIKIFKHNGRKMNDEEENNLESYFSTSIETPFQGKYKQKNLSKIYINFLASCSDVGLENYKICLDCSNGSSYKIAPKVFKKLGAEVFVTGGKNKGELINKECGSLHIENLIKYVKEKKANFGFAFDGDADRLIAVDDSGEVFDGDKILYILAKQMKKEGKLYANTVVGTSHTNSGIMNALNKHKINLIRTDIGDKYVIDAMEKMNLSLGGEQSGHIILRDKIKTGDGILTAITLANVIAKEKKTMAELFDAHMLPQANIDCIVHDKMKVMNNEELRLLLSNISCAITPAGRVLVRASGTENKIRIMVEHMSQTKAKKLAKEIKNLVMKI